MTRPADAWSDDAADGMDGGVGELGHRLSRGSLVTDPHIMEAYRRDRADVVAAGTPLAVVRAADVRDVSQTLAWAQRRGVPVVPRGAGTGLSGGANALDASVVLSLERLTAIRDVDPSRRAAVVEAGVRNADVSRAVARHGLMYAPDPGSWEISTIGGNIATNAGGMRCVKYGVTRDSVLGLEAVLADGRVVRTGTGASKDVAGYDLTSLLTGSEGTLGVVTAATLRLLPQPAVPPVTFVASFGSLEALGAAVDAIAASGVRPSLLELLDRATVNAVEDYRRMDLDRDSAGLLIGQADGHAGEQDARVMVELCAQAGADLAVVATSPTESDLLLQARRLAGTAVMSTGPTVIEDVGVPPGRLTAMLRAVERIGAECGVDIATTGHAGDGNLHPMLRLRDLEPATVAGALEAGRRLCAAAADLGGTITAEHGVGVLKQSWLRQQLDPVALELHQAIKAALDPRGILNPGRSF